MTQLYKNPLAHRLGLSDDDMKVEAKLERLCDDLQSKVLTPIPTEIDWRFTTEDMSPEAALAADWSAWPEFGPRTVWGRKQGHTFIAAEIEVPEAAARGVLLLQFTSQWQERPGSTDPQCLAWLDGEIFQAIDGNHTELVIARDAVPGTRVRLLIDAFTFFDRPLVSLGARMMLRNERVERLFYDIRTPFDVACHLPMVDVRRKRILALVERALRALDRRDNGPQFLASLPAAEAIAAEIYALADTEARPVISAFGHTHIDVAWLWRVLHTREKAGRSFATALKLMEEFPDFVFMYNQAVVYDYLKADYPALWAKIKDRITGGQLEIEGAMWLEPDVNITSGESLVRQIMFGRRFHQQNFGVTPTSVWLPDTFGYSANLPQIMEGAGLEHFITSKISWNETDRFPYDVFFWQGIDGTRVKARLITTQEDESDEIFTTYNSMLTVSEVMGAWKRFEPKAASDDVLICYGYGDGGGGPTRAMIQRGQRLERGIPGAPDLRMEGLGTFLKRAGADMDAAPGSFPVWNGELYLELHRGTLTTVAKNKANNRMAERKLRELEFLAAMATLNGAAYPDTALDGYWKTVLLNQFHDILPGTSIPEVYEDSDAEYGALFDAMTTQDGPWHQAASSAMPETGLKIVNFTGQERHELVDLGSDTGFAGKSISMAGETVPVQKLTRADGQEVFAAPLGPVPPLGWVGAALTETPALLESGVSASARHLENAHLLVRFDDSGEIASVFDKEAGRELLPQGARANSFVAYEDKPKNWEAWDIDDYFEEQFWPLADAPAEIELIETGPYRAALRISRPYQASQVVQVVSLTAGARMVEFDTFIDWQERHQVLKVLFPFDLNTSEIRSEIQFGHVRRATHRNTSWDRARFEASMHRWVDMSEPDFGAALINDCKYAYDAHEQMVRLTLLRGTTYPNPEADLGEHRLRYGLYLHGGERDVDAVHRAAERFNTPLAVVGRPDGTQAPAFSFAASDAPNVTLETVKKAEADGDIVLRLYEHANRRVRSRISFGLPVAAVARVNLMEEGAEPLILTDNGVELELKPFEIVTLKITPAEVLS